MLHAAAESVQLPHHDSVALAQHAEHAVELWAMRSRSTRGVLEYLIAARLNQPIALKIGALLACAHPGIAKSS